MPRNGAGQPGFLVAYECKSVKSHAEFPTLPRSDGPHCAYISRFSVSIELTRSFSASTQSSSVSGAQLDCPTCSQKLIIPQAPASGGSKLIVSAIQVGKPRPPQNDALLQDAAPIPARRMSLVSFVVWILVVCAAAGAIFTFR